MPRLKILSVVSECVPFAKTGGLADVAGALPLALAARGHDVRVVLPRYRATKKFAAAKLPQPLRVPLGNNDLWAALWEAPLGHQQDLQFISPPRAYLLEHDRLFDRDGVYGDFHGEFGDNLARFTFLSRGALSLCRSVGFLPDVIHVHDWPTALVPIYLNTLARDTPLQHTASVLTIHNLGYQGWFNKELLPLTGLGWDLFHSRGLEAYDSLNLLKGGIYHATVISTVSPRYAEEIQTPEAGTGLDGVLRDRGGDIVGILNGIDDTIWNPETDRHLAANYSVNQLEGKRLCKAALQGEMHLPQRPEVPLIGLISRLVGQKGIEILAGALNDILSLDVQVVILGSGEKWAEDLFARLSHSSDRFRAFIGMNDALAHRIEAGADLYVMPSVYEPCGLNQMYSQRYGTLPIVRAVGGLDDTVDHLVTGFKFDELSSYALANTVALAVHIYRAEPTHFRGMQLRSMKKPMGWGYVSRQYEALYRMAIARRRGG